MKSWHIIVATLAIVVLWVGIGLGPLWLYPQGTERGTFGDQFGAVNALFSGLAFLGVVVAILLQRQELSLQREELQLTRSELHRTAAAQESSSDALSKQFRMASLTARISAYSSLIQSCNDQIAALHLADANRQARMPSMFGARDTAEIKGRRAKYEHELTTLLQQIETEGKANNTVTPTEIS